jgi:hypothetical protein
MRLAELQSWLAEESLRDELDDLTRRTVRTELDNLADASEHEPSAAPDWPRLLFAGSILARSDERQYQETRCAIGSAP